MNDGSSAAELAAALGIFVMPILGWIVVRYLSHRERMEMIRHGMAPAGKVRGRDWQRAAAPSPEFRVQDVSADQRRGQACAPDLSQAGLQITLRKGIT
ncbi:MAG: hypothetical protein IAI49_14530, partial [Candidatus Eremiobacteraeota bacterium]|nr:hypothetical protein [Candidatus Eremiobacteraeota bacterium]